VTRERRLAFGDVAELYDQARPSYPPELVDDVVAYAAAGPGDRALEVGAGTGKATTMFAARGLDVLALGPSAEMAAVAARNCDGFENVAVEQREFERWSPGPRRFALVFSAQAWHWLAPEVRYVRAREALRPGGALAVFWNRPDWESCPLRDELAEAYREVAPDLGAGAARAGAGPGPMHPGIQTPPPWWADWTAEMTAAPGFGAPEPRVYRWRENYTTDAYLRVLRTHSDHIVLGASRLEQLLGAVRGVLDRDGGGLPLDYLSVLWMTRASGDPQQAPG
jgi:SAM-dependent methyltransferase